MWNSPVRRPPVGPVRDVEASFHDGDDMLLLSFYPRLGFLIYIASAA